MDLIKELIQLLEASDAQLERLRAQKHEISDQIEEIVAAGGEVPEELKRKRKALSMQIKAKLGRNSVIGTPK